MERKERDKGEERAIDALIVAALLHDDTLEHLADPSADAAALTAEDRECLDNLPADFVARLVAGGHTPATGTDVPGVPERTSCIQA